MLHLRKMAFVVWENDSKQAAVPSALSSEPQTPDFSHVMLVHSILPLLEPRVSSCEWNFVCWPFNRVPVSPVDSCLSLAYRSPSAFHYQILYGCLFPALVLRVGEPDLMFRTHICQGEPSLCSWDTSLEPPVGMGQPLMWLYLSLL